MSLFWLLSGGYQTYAQTEDPKPIIFTFDVEITLSNKAAKRLKLRHESIVVSADYYGEPKPDAQEHANEIGMIDLGVENVEVVGPKGLVKLTGTKIDIRGWTGSRGRCC